MEQELITESEIEYETDTEKRCEIHNRRLVKRKHHTDWYCPICKNPFFNSIWEEVFKRNKNCLIVIEGTPGDGKSYISMKIGQDLDETFTPDNLQERMIFSPRQFLKLVSQDRLKKGNVIVIEEAGVQADHRKWFSFNNMAINYILQTFRYQNLIVIFNVPVIDYIDADARKIFKYHIETIRVIVSEKLNKYKVKQQQYNSATKKIYRKFLRFNINGRWVKFRNWHTKKPGAKLCNVYEKLHTDFKHELAVRLDEEMRVMEKQVTARRHRNALNEDAAAQELLAEYEKDPKGGLVRWSSKNKPAITVSIVENKYNVGRAIGARIKHKAEALIYNKYAKKREEKQRKRDREKWAEWPGA